MNESDKGRRYARLFRKAGVFLAKGNIALAIEVLNEGRLLAQESGDLKMAQRFAEEIARAGRPGENPA